MDKKETTIKEEMNTSIGKPPEDDINNSETCYNPEMIQELFGESFDQSYQFEGDTG